MKISVLLISLLALACGSPPSATTPSKVWASDETKTETKSIEKEPIELGKYIKVYTGREGLKVTIADLAGSDPERALILVEGVKNKLDGLALLYTSSVSQQGPSYSTILNGQASYTVRTNTRWRSSHLEVHLPGEAEAMPIAFDEEETKKANASKLLEAYRKIEADGTIAKLQEFDRSAPVKRHNESMVEAAQDVNEICGGSLKASIDWKSVSEEQLKQFSIASYCGEGLTAMEWLCKNNAEAKKKMAKVTQFSCSFGGDLKISVAKTTVSFSVPTDASNPAKKAARQLASSLGFDRVVLKNGEKILVVGVMDSSDPIHLGNGTNFSQVRILRGAGTYSRPLWWSKGTSSLEAKDGKWHLICGKKERKLEVVTGAARKNALSAKMGGPSFKRQPYVIAHGDKMKYYYVDTLAPAFDEKGKDYRLFVGKKGAMKPVVVKEVVEFRGGHVFETDKGQFRVAIYRDGDGSADFGADKKREQLLTLPLSTSSNLIYHELGVYKAADLSTPCD